MLCVVLLLPLTPIAILFSVVSRLLLLPIELQINIHCFLTHSSWRKVEDLQMVLEEAEGEEGIGNFEINETAIRDSKSLRHLWSSGGFGGPRGFQSDKTSSWCLSTFLFLFASMPSEQKA